MSRLLCAAASALLFLPCGDEIRADALSDLHSPDLATRRAAIAQIQTWDDPRIPAACLPLLRDPGLSIQRLAARAIGSRFYQISEEERPRYLAALQACLERRKHQPPDGSTYGEDDITLMCQRAIGLLKTNYELPPFSLSPDGRWVLYERRRRPVVANIGTQVHYLLSPLNPEGYRVDDAYYSEDDDLDKPPETDLLKTVDTNLPVRDLFAPHWRPGGGALAFTLERLQARFYHPILVWTAAAPSGVKVLDEASFQSLLRGSGYPQWGTTTDFVAWKGDLVLIKVYNCDYPDGNHPPDAGVTVSYDIRTGKIARAR